MGEVGKAGKRRIRAWEPESYPHLSMSLWAWEPESYPHVIMGLGTQKLPLLLFLFLFFLFSSSILIPSEASHLTVVDGWNSSDLVADVLRRSNCPAGQSHDEARIAVNSMAKPILLETTHSLAQGTGSQPCKSTNTSTSVPRSLILDQQLSLVNRHSESSTLVNTRVLAYPDQANPAFSSSFSSGQLSTLGRSDLPSLSVSHLTCNRNHNQTSLHHQNHLPAMQELPSI